jgi:hypothetical protein
MIYNCDHQETEAFATFAHEIIEYKLKEVTRIYRVLINNLIEGYKKLAYQQKEDFIEFIPKFVEVQKQQINFAKKGKLSRLGCFLEVRMSVNDPKRDS